MNMDSKREKWFRLFLYWWILGFLWASFVQTFLPEMVASHTVWGFAPGWQREIAIWNLAMICVLLGVLRSGIKLGNSVIAGLCVLFALLGLNHLSAVVESGAKHGFTIVVLNFVPLLAVVLLLIFTKRRSA